MDSEQVHELYVIYDADGTITGEIIYITKKLLGLAHCAACEITHGRRREKPEFTELKMEGWAVPLRNIHRDEMDAGLKRAVNGVLPCVVARTDYRDVVLLGPSELESCRGEVLCFQKIVNEALRKYGLRTPKRERAVCVPSSFANQACSRDSVQDNGSESDSLQDAVVPSSPDS